ncbi:hypothetical protein MSSAC_2401 [Methanosarcina siciliae C2J]|uniref:Uncharacterized protein n=1 Tax=Methanosarcina siciliae C2J TaxID=1434118 RepID=A0A0E3LDB7_9EURY|nr:hypothetical protein [Methanosarcina siciliae]AKB36991.1 hypothetical protein MSSAC_2401 [Methanosarcina siciliae C2J]
MNIWNPEKNRYEVKVYLIEPPKEVTLNDKSYDSFFSNYNAGQIYISRPIKDLQRDNYGELFITLYIEPEEPDSEPVLIKSIRTNAKRLLEANTNFITRWHLMQLLAIDNRLKELVSTLEKEGVL